VAAGDPAGGGGGGGLEQQGEGDRASGRKVTTMPAAIAVAPNTSDGRTSRGFRSPATTPSWRADPAERVFRATAGRAVVEATATRAAAAPAMNTAG
jgi:hypothetical protein